MVVLDEIEMCGDATFHEVTPPNCVLTDSQSFHSWGHRSKGGKGFVAAHQNVLGNPVGKLQVGEVFLVEPCAEIFCRLRQ